MSSKLIQELPQRLAIMAMDLEMSIEDRSTCQLASDEIVRLRKYFLRKGKLKATKKKSAEAKSAITVAQPREQ